MMMATKAPTTAIQSGMPTGMFSARMMPVTTADRSPAVFGFFSSISYKYSNATQARVVTATSTRACTPKISPAASTAGSSAMTTLPISPRVVVASRMCGEAVTIRRSSIGYLPPFRSSAIYQPLARPIVWLTGRLAGQA